jgi:hypothetical protein
MGCFSKLLPPKLGNPGGDRLPADAASGICGGETDACGETTSSVIAGGEMATLFSTNKMVGSDVCNTGIRLVRPAGSDGAPAGCKLSVAVAVDVDVGTGPAVGLPGGLLDWFSRSCCCRSSVLLSDPSRLVVAQLVAEEVAFGTAPSIGLALESSVEFTRLLGGIDETLGS